MSKETTPIVDAASAKAFTSAAVSAFAGHASTIQKAGLTLMDRVAKAAGAIGKPITAATYDAKCGPLVAKAFEVKVKAEAMTQGTANKVRSQLKLATLAILSNAATPEPGEGFNAFLARAAECIGAAKLADGTPVWAAKVGRKPVQGKAQAKAAGKAVKQAAQQEAKALSSKSGDAPTARVTPQMAAALILSGDNRSRAARLVKVMESYAAEFDKWSAALLADSAKAETKEAA